MSETRSRPAHLPPEGLAAGTGPVHTVLPSLSGLGQLVDVWPNGFALNLTDGILRVRYRNSPEKAELMKPSET
jgi:hypothetical protein